MTQINISNDLLNKIRKESELTGVKMYKLVEISFNTYINQDVRSIILKEVKKIKDEILKSHNSIVKEEIKSIKEEEMMKRKLLDEKIKNQKIQYNNLLKRIESLKKK